MDNGATDSSGDTCIWYEENHRHCGDYDDDDFDARDLCCSCKLNGNFAKISHSRVLEYRRYL